MLYVDYTVNYIKKITSKESIFCYQKGLLNNSFGRIKSMVAESAWLRLRQSTWRHLSFDVKNTVLVYV